MTALDRNPATVNLLTQVDFSLKIKRCPQVEFFAQKINLPGIVADGVEVATPLATIQKNYDHLRFNNLNVTFKVDEQLTNYLEIHNWMRALGPTKDFTGYQNLNRQPKVSGLGLYSDMVLMILDANKNPKFEVTFMNAFPIELQDLNFSSDLRDVEYQTVSASFVYTLYEINKL